MAEPYEYDPSPCLYCGTNAWTSCKHRQGAVKPKPPKEYSLFDDEEKPDRRKSNQGYNFHGAKSKELQSKLARKKRGRYDR